MQPVLLVPGIFNSGPAHWQSLWEARHPGVSRIQQRDWDHPRCAEWSQGIEDAVRQCAQPPLLVAHSLGCLAAAHWASRSRLAVHGLLLVAVPDPAGPNFPAQAQGFAPPPASLGGRRAVMVSSSDDPYSSPHYSDDRASQWEAEHLRLGACGHINADSGLADWPWGWALVECLRA